MLSNQDILILGGGVTGLAAGLASGGMVCEAADAPGGICASYYLREGGERLAGRPMTDDAWQFEIGGGHWIFGGSPDVLDLIERLAPCAEYTRNAALFFPDEQRWVDYPIQNHLHQWPEDVRLAALNEMLHPPAMPVHTMADWLRRSFGPTLGTRFFEPFHRAYTAGLYPRIAPQDGYKSPLDVVDVLRGAIGSTRPAGYNTRFLYPLDGLDALVRALAGRVDLHCGWQAEAIDTARQTVRFANGEERSYRRLISTLPLTTTLRLAGLAVDEPPADPHTAVLVLNIAAERGPHWVDRHWIYLPETQSGFHRVGCYSAVSPYFLPSERRGDGRSLSLYVERAWPAGVRPDADAVAAYTAATLAELRAWGWINDVVMCDPTWIDVAYTWSWPQGDWARRAMQSLRSVGVVPAGRYGCWRFQGIAESLRDGLVVGSSLAVV